MREQIRVFPTLLFHFSGRRLRGKGVLLKRRAGAHAAVGPNYMLQSCRGGESYPCEGALLIPDVVLFLSLVRKTFSVDIFPL